MAAATDRDEAAPEPEVERGVEARVGQVVAGSYRIVRHLGSGGSSHVFQVEHVRLGRAFALKLLRSELDQGRSAAQRFRREARAVARLQSEYVVSVIDCGELDDQTPYMVTELLEGRDLRALLAKEGQLPVRRAVRLMLEACLGISAVHAAGLVHRDLKPENLFITRRGAGEDWCKVLDFGVAKMEASADTVQGAIIGTARYMAPEQLTDSASVGPAADIYAIGAILYECLSGKAAHPGRTIQEVMFAVMNKEPAALHELRPNLPPALLEIVEDCLIKDPAQRAASAADLVERLRRVLGEDHTSPEVTLAETAQDYRPVATAPARVPATSSRAIWVTGLLSAAAAAGAVWALKPAAASTPIAPTAPSVAAAIFQRPPAAATHDTRQDAKSVEPAPSPAAPAAAAATDAARSASPAPAPVEAARPTAPVLHGNTQAGTSNRVPAHLVGHVAAPAPASSPATSPKRPVVGNLDQSNPYGE